MTKLAELLNEFYMVEGLSTRELINEMRKELDVHEFGDELNKLLLYLDNEVK